VNKNYNYQGQQSAGGNFKDAGIALLQVDQPALQAFLSFQALSFDSEIAVGTKSVRNNTLGPLFPQYLP